MAGRAGQSRARSKSLTLAIILARAGSKGVPGKNWALIAGKPCVLYTIQAAQAAQARKTIDLVAVSTDDRVVASIADNAGCLCVKRPRECASDTATVDDAARHALSAIEALTDEVEGGLFDNVVILYANVPVRPAGLIDRAVKVLRSTGCDSVQSYQPVGKHHPWWTARVDERSGRVRPWEGAVLNHGVYRRQDLPPAFIPDGAVIAVTRRALLRQIKHMGRGTQYYVPRTGA